MQKALPGINIQAPWARLLLEGKKSIETRTYPLPEKYLGQELWLIETPGHFGKFKARVIGVIKFSGYKAYKSASEFYGDKDLHLVEPNNTDYAWKKGIPKYGWMVESVRKIQIFEAPSPRGILYSRPFNRQPRL